MKYRRLWAVAVTAALVSWFVPNSRALADEKSQEGKETEATIVVQVADPECEAQKCEPQKVRVAVGSAVAVCADDEDKEGKEKRISITLQAADSEGKGKKFELKKLGEDVIPLRVQVQKIEAGSQENLGQVLEGVTEKLKQAGLDEKKIKQVKEAIEKAKKAAGDAKQARAIVVMRKEGQLDAKRFMLGVSCAPVADALRSQMNLEEGVGLVVESVFDDTAAKKAGIREHDVLVRAGEKKLQGPEDLVEAVQAAGQENNKLNVTLLRGGKEKSIEVTPTERMVYTMELDLPEGALKQDATEDAKTLVTRAITVGPGWVTRMSGAHVRDSEIDSLKKKLDQLSRQLDELQKAVKKLQADD
jgi:peptidoglycan hydrolase CwlO-like protein